MRATSRRQFLTGIGSGLGRAAIGVAIFDRLGFAEAMPLFPRGLALDRLRFGALDPLVDLLQATPADAMLPLVVGKLRAGTPLADVVGAAALANARAFGGTNYDGYHTLMAMMPSFEMAAQMPEPHGPLPVLKVLHRNARTLHAAGREDEDALEPLAEPAPDPNLVGSVRARDLDAAERSLAALEARSPDDAYERLQTVVRDEPNVHRVVLAWRAYDLLRLAGQDQSTTMLRQSVRFCIDEDGSRAERGQPEDPMGVLVPKLMAEHGLEGRERGTRSADDPWIEQLSHTIFAGDRAEAAAAAATALAKGYDPEDVGRAMSLAATMLLLNDPGRTQEAPGKPVGSVHGASWGVHASDAANAWRHIARTGSAANAFASLIAGAYHTAGQSQYVREVANDEGAEPCTKEDPAELLSEIDGRIRDRDQVQACQAAHRYCALGHSHEALFALLLGHAVSEDGALHAEKYFRTAQDEHSVARAAHRPLYLVALTRVMASQHGFPAPGLEEARALLAG